MFSPCQHRLQETAVAPVRDSVTWISFRSFLLTFPSLSLPLSLFFLFGQFLIECPSPPHPKQVPCSFRLSRSLCSIDR